MESVMTRSEFERPFGNLTFELQKHYFGTDAHKEIKRR